MWIFTHKIIPEKMCTDITSLIEKDLFEFYKPSGLIIVYSKHTTACIRILENESLLRLDEKDFMERLASSNCLYRHDNITERDVPPDERRNGYSHLRSMLLNHQESIPVLNGKLDLGTWQRVFYIENDLGKDNRTWNVLYIPDIVNIINHA